MEARRTPIVDVVIPALDEAGSIGRVLADLPAGTVRQVVVADHPPNHGVDAAAMRRVEGCHRAAIALPGRRDQLNVRHSSRFS